MAGVGSYYDQQAQQARYNAEQGMTPGALQKRQQGVADIGNQQEEGSYGQYSAILDGLANAISGGANAGGAAVPAVPGINGVPSSYGSAATSVPSYAAPSSVTMPDTSAADAATFGREKDQAAQITSGSLEGLRGALQARGMGGGGYEAGQTGRALVAGTNLEGEASRGIAEQNANLAEKRASEQYQGGVTQRGQDVGAAVATHGQELQAQEQAAQLAQEQAQSKANQQLQMLQLALGSFKAPSLSY